MHLALTTWTLVTDTVSLSSTDATATIDPDAPLSGGTAAFNITIGTAGAYATTAADVSDSTKADASGAEITVAP